MGYPQGPPGYGYPPPPGMYGAAGSDGYGQAGMLGSPPVQNSDAFSLQNGRMLKAELGDRSGMTEFFAKSGAMVAYQGGVSFDGNSQTWGAQAARSMTGVSLPLMKVAGAGTVFLANQAQDVHILDLTGDSFTIDRDNLLAFAPSLRWSVVRVDSQQRVGGMDSFNIELTGRGQFVACTTGPPLVMNVTPSNYYFADADAVIGWSTSLQVQMQAAVTTAGVWSPRGNTGESWQMQFSGEGVVIVQPAELMPPYNALAGVGLLGQVTGLASDLSGNSWR